MKRRNSKYIHFYFKNYPEFLDKNKNSNILPLMKKSKTNKDISTTYNQEEINKRILRKIHYNYILKQFNLYCKKSAKRISSKYISNITDEQYNNTNTKIFSRNRKTNYKTQENFYKNSNYDLFSIESKNKDNFVEEEKIYDFRQKFCGEKDKIIQLRHTYKFYNLPKYEKDEITSKKIKNVFSNNDFDFNLNNKFKPRMRTIAKIKNHSFNEKLYLENKQAKTMENKIIKKYKNSKIKIHKKNKEIDIIDINDFINNNLKNIDYFNSVSNSGLKISFENPINIKKKEYKFPINLKLTKKSSKYKIYLKND